MKSLQSFSLMDPDYPPTRIPLDAPFFTLSTLLLLAHATHSDSRPQPILSHVNRGEVCWKKNMAAALACGCLCGKLEADHEIYPSYFGPLYRTHLSVHPTHLSTVFMKNTLRRS
ncbi:hypothetical protein C8R47DRAFT_223549 [Mycena vitilis]|nr:hypothetical protein C8R47DRAFT_223549 [Mycena vitilis]